MVSTTHCSKSASPPWRLALAALLVAITAFAFARHGGRTYSKPEADRALALSIDFFKQYLA